MVLCLLCGAAGVLISFVPVIGGLSLIARLRQCGLILRHYRRLCSGMLTLDQADGGRTPHGAADFCAYRILIRREGRRRKTPNNGHGNKERRKRTCAKSRAARRVRVFYALFVQKSARLYRKKLPTDFHLYYETPSQRRVFFGIFCSVGRFCVRLNRKGRFEPCMYKKNYTEKRHGQIFASYTSAPAYFLSLQRVCQKRRRAFFYLDLRQLRPECGRLSQSCSFYISLRNVSSPLVYFCG